MILFSVFNLELLFGFRSFWKLFRISLVFALVLV